MQSISCLALALLQDDAGALQHDLHLIMIFMMVIMIAVVLGFLGIAVGGLMGLKLFRKLEEMAEGADAKVSPVLVKTHALIEELGPKVTTITKNVEQISYTVRGKVDEFAATADEINRTVKDANKRTQAQVVRVDGIVNEAMQTAQQVSRTVQEGVRKPVLQIAGIVAAVKKGIETWVERSPFKRNVREAEETYPPYDAPRRYTTTTTEYTTTTESKRTTPYG
ncbi:MAG TPA: hypothetical protein VMD97_05500 [Candidatus Aquilonibacter sp.]|nr:hypothetical protein [Candidatus Aquilonibacter sp.]